MKNKIRIKSSVMKSAKALGSSFPLIFGTILLVSLFSSIITKSMFENIFSNNFLLDPLWGSITGSILAGNPIISYIFGGEFLKQGVSLVAVTAFIVSWVTVGILQIPAESAILGKKFALIRNLTAFILSIIVAIITVLIFEVFK